MGVGRRPRIGQFERQGGGAEGAMLLLVAAPLSYHYFEKPFLRLKARYGSTPRSSPQTPSSTPA